jgi:hypothetical protein
MTRKEKEEETSCHYKHQTQPIRVCTRWMHSNLKIQYVFLGTRGLTLKPLLQKVERVMELTSDEKEQLATLLPASVSKLQNLRFIHRTLFIDDTRVQVLYKTVRFIQEYYTERSGDFSANESNLLLTARFNTRKDLPIAWSYRQAWLFSVDKSWNQWKANPWLLDASIQQSPSVLFQTISKTPTHEYVGDDLSLDTALNFTFPWDCPFMQSAPELLRWYTVWKDEFELTSWEQLNYEEGRLSEIWNFPKLPSATNMVQLEKCFIQEYHESGTFSTKHAFAELFDSIPISTNIPFIQWMGDKYHILYRLYKQHSLDEATLNQLTDISKVSTESRLTFMIRVKDSPIYIKLVLELSGHYYVHVKMSGYPIQIHRIHDAIHEMKHLMQRLYKLKMTYSESDVRSKLMLKYSPNLSNAVFFQELSKYGWLYSVKEKEMRQQRIKLMYLRSMTSHQRVRPEEFIRAQMMFIENDDELIRILEDTFGLTTTKASEWLNDYRTSDGGWVSDAFTSDKLKKWLQIPSFITLTRNGQNIQVVCERFANMEDVYRMTHWLQGTLVDIGLKAQASSAKTPNLPPSKPELEPNQPEKKKVELPKDISLSSSSESPVGRSRSMSSSASASSSSNSRRARTESSSFGGGGYDLNEELKQADPVIFKETTLPNNPSRYPRLCSANTNQQPIVVSQADMKRIDDSEFKEAYDNKLLYGSEKDSRKHNYYFCPRIWCPLSKVPMTYEMLQSKTYNGKCPGPHYEEPWMMYDTNYWGKDPNKTHYIGFHSKQGTNGLCLPCCKINGTKNQEENPMWKKCTSHVKKEKPESESVPPKPDTDQPDVPPGPKKRGRKAKVDKDDKEEYYLLHIDAPITTNRWGVLPETLHQVVSPKTQSYVSCYTQLKSDNACLVRKGIHHRKDSLLNALGYLLTQGKGGKKELIEEMMKRITPYDFLTFENGWWVVSLLDKDPILPQTHLSEILSWKSWIQKYPSYISTMRLQSIVDTAGASLELSTKEQLQLSRELAIYRAWKRFWIYIKSNEPKEVLLMYDMLRCMGVHLIVWEKTSPEKVYLRCPLPTSMNDIYTTLYDMHLPYIILMHENDYYEPIELKSRGADGITLLDDSDLVHRLNQLRNQCGDNGTTFLQKYQLLSTFPQTIFQDAKEWMPHTLILGPTLNIQGVLLKCGIYVYWTTPIPLKYLNDWMNVLQVSNVRYLEDVSISSKRITLSSNQLVVYMRLLQFLELKWNVASIEEDTVVTSSIIDERASYIPTNTMNQADELILKYDSDYRHWTQLQKIIGARMMKDYTTLIEPLLKLDKPIQLERLERIFHFIPYPKKIRVILEEIPYTSTEALKEWYLRIGSYQKYPFYSSLLQNGHSQKEWLFSQSALRTMTGGSIWTIPNKIQKPSKVMHAPELSMESPKTLLKPYALSHTRPISETPISKANMVWSSLPSKWLIMKKYDWQDYKLCSSKQNYTFHDAWKWLCDEYKVALSKELFQLAHQLKVASMIEQEDLDILTLYLQEPSVWRGLAKILHMEKSKSVTVVKHFLRLSKQEQWDTWLDYYKLSHQHVVDLDIWLFANLTNSVVLMMHRSPSGVGVDTSERNRFQDFISSATVYHNNALSWKELTKRPLVIFYKKSKLDAEHAQYEWVVYKETHFYFKQMKEAPKILNQLIEAVVNAQK